MGRCSSTVVTGLRQQCRKIAASYCWQYAEYARMIRFWKSNRGWGVIHSVYEGEMAVDMVVSPGSSAAT